MLVEGVGSRPQKHLPDVSLSWTRLFWHKDSPISPDSLFSTFLASWTSPGWLFVVLPIIDGSLLLLCQAPIGPVPDTAQVERGVACYMSGAIRLILVALGLWRCARPYRLRRCDGVEALKKSVPIKKPLPEYSRSDIR